jgi:hypothetical protein
MQLETYVESLRGQLGFEDERSVSAIRLTLLEALSDAADEITRELAPGSVELRLRSGVPEFVTSTPPPVEEEPPAPAVVEDDDSAMVRINLRLSEQLKASVEAAASGERMSVNAWLVRAATNALAPSAGARAEKRGGRLGQSYKGWVQ